DVTDRIEGNGAAAPSRIAAARDHRCLNQHVSWIRGQGDGAADAATASSGGVYRRGAGDAHRLTAVQLDAAPGAAVVAIAIHSPLHDHRPAAAVQTDRPTIAGVVAGIVDDSRLRHGDAAGGAGNRGLAAASVARCHVDGAAHGRVPLGIDTHRTAAAFG